MKQVTMRLPEGLAEHLRQAAAERGQSVNAYATAVLSAAVDPDLAGDEATRLRERLARAGLLDTDEGGGARPEPARLRRARHNAGQGTRLSDLVREGRR